MVDPKADPLCNQQHCRLFDCPDAVCDLGGRCVSRLCDYSGNPDTHPLFHGTRGGGLHNGHSAGASDRQHHHDLAGRDRVLSC